MKEMGYDFSNIFFDASNMYTFMEENDMAKKGHNKYNIVYPHIESEKPCKNSMFPVILL